MLDSLLAPADGFADLRAIGHRVLILRRLDELVVAGLDVLLEQVDVETLDISVVDALVEQLVDDHEVVLDALLLDLLEVAFEHLDKALQKLDDHQRVRVLVRNREDYSAYTAGWRGKGSCTRSCSPRRR